jgi:LysM repeat protein
MRVGLVVVFAGVAMWVFLLGELTPAGGDVGTVVPRNSALPGSTLAAEPAAEEPAAAVHEVGATPTATATATAPGNVYIVQAGDTMARIAQRHNVTLRDLLNANPQIQNPERIAVGDRITIPGR